MESVPEDASAGPRTSNPVEAVDDIAGPSRQLDQPTSYHRYTDEEGGAVRPPTRQRFSLSYGTILGGHETDNNDDNDNDDEFRVTSLELFSDLVVVVAIHIVSKGLEDEKWLTSLQWYFIYVFQLWLLWHVSTIGFHVSHLFQDQDNGMDNALHYLAVVTFMILILLLAGAQAGERPTAALILFMIVRVFEVGVLWLQVQRTPPHNFDPIRLAVLKSIPNTMIPWVLFGEILPLSLSLYLSPDGGQTPYLPLLYLSFSLIIAQRTYGAYKGDKMQREKSKHNLLKDSTVKKIFDPSLLKERYELMALIFTAEIVFGATAGMHADELTFIILAVSAVLSAFGSYLLCFRTHPPTSQSFWNASGMRIITGQHFYAGLFSVIPGMAAGYIQIGEAIVERNKEDQDGFSEKESCDLESSLLLCCSVAAFLFFSGLIHFINVSPKDTKSRRLGEKARRGFWLLFFLIAVSLACLDEKRGMCLGSIPVVVFLCPLLPIMCAFVEVWGSLDKNTSFSDAVVEISASY
jgi:low temperature requirement protein LtrA